MWPGEPELPVGNRLDYRLLVAGCDLWKAAACFSCGFFSRSLTTAQILLRQPFAVFAVSWVRWCMGPRPGAQVPSWTSLCLEDPH